MKIEGSMVTKAAEISRRERAVIFVEPYGLDDVVMNRNKRGFSGMLGCVSRLKRV